MAKLNIINSLPGEKQFPLPLSLISPLPTNDQLQRALSTHTQTHTYAHTKQASQPSTTYAHTPVELLLSCWHADRPNYSSVAAMEPPAAVLSSPQLICMMRIFFITERVLCQSGWKRLGAAAIKGPPFSEAPPTGRSRLCSALGYLRVFSIKATLIYFKRTCHSGFAKQWKYLMICPQSRLNSSTSSGSRTKSRPRTKHTQCQHLRHKAGAYSRRLLCALNNN